MSRSRCRPRAIPSIPNNLSSPTKTSKPRQYPCTIKSSLDPGELVYNVRFSRAAKPSLPYPFPPPPVSSRHNSTRHGSCPDVRGCGYREDERRRTWVPMKTHLAFDRQERTEGQRRRYFEAFSRSCRERARTWTPRAEKVVCGGGEGCRCGAWSSSSSSFLELDIVA